MRIITSLKKGLATPGVVSGTACGLAVGTVMGIGFAILVPAPSALILVPIDTAVGLVFGVIAGFIMRLLGEGITRQGHIILTSIFYGGTVGAIALMPFSEGLFMSAFLAGEGRGIGVCLGALIGAIAAHLTQPRQR